MLLIDSHLDLAMNSIEWDRDLELDVYEIRRREANMTEKGPRDGARSPFPRCARRRWGSAWLR